MQNIPVSKGANKSMGDNMQKERHQPMSLRGLGEPGRRGSIKTGQINIHTMTGADEIGNDKTDQQGHRGCRFKPDQRFGTDTTN